MVFLLVGSNIFHCIRYQNTVAKHELTIIEEKTKKVSQDYTLYPEKNPNWTSEEEINYLRDMLSRSRIQVQFLHDKCYDLEKELESFKKKQLEVCK